jgi:hypothetical protein
MAVDFFRIDDRIYQQSLDWLHNYIDANCIVRDKYMKGKVPGTSYSWCFYLRKGLYNPEFNKHMTVCFLKKFANELGQFQLGGMETAATPMVTAIPIYAKQLLNVDIHSFVFRKAPKEYGLEEPWEGTPNDLPIILCDDLANSTMSLRKASDICRDYNMPKKNRAFVIVNKVNRDYYDMRLPEEYYGKTDHELRQSHDMYLDKDVDIISLFDMDDFNLKGASH